MVVLQGSILCIDSGSHVYLVTSAIDINVFNQSLNQWEYFQFIHYIIEIHLDDLSQVGSGFVINHMTLCSSVPAV